MNLLEVTVLIEQLEASKDKYDLEKLVPFYKKKRKELLNENIAIILSVTDMTAEAANDLIEIEVKRLRSKQR